MNHEMSKFIECSLANARDLTPDETAQVGGGARFGNWVGHVTVWMSGVGLVADLISGGALSDAAGKAMSRFEDVVNG